MLLGDVADIWIDLAEFLPALLLAMLLAGAAWRVWPLTALARWSRRIREEPVLRPRWYQAAVALPVRTAHAGLRWWTGWSLIVEDFKGDNAGGIDGAGIRAALVAAMSRAGSTLRSGVALAEAPVKADTAFNAVKEGLSIVPEGKRAAALLSLARLVPPRKDLRLSGHLISSQKRGPGLALTVRRPGGRTEGSVVVWAESFEPVVEGHVYGDHADRLQRLAIVGAVWTHFNVLRAANALRTESELRRFLSTPSWESYAFQLLGVDGATRDPARVTRSCYARALDADPKNMQAAFNLAQIELDGELAEIGRKRLDRLHHELEEVDAKAATRRNKLWWRQERPVGEKDSDRATVILLKSPLHYQVACSQGADACNQAGQNDLDTAGLRDVFERLTEDLACLEQALFWLERSKLSAEGVRRLEILRRIEGPTIIQWAQLCRSDGGRLASPPVPNDPPKRDDLAKRLWESPSLVGSDEIVDRHLLLSGLVTVKTRYNLACYYAYSRREEDAFQDLEMSLEAVRLPDSELTALAGWVKDDPILSWLKKRDRKRWNKIMSRLPDSHDGRIWDRWFRAVSRAR